MNYATKNKETRCHPFESTKPPLSSSARRSQPTKVSSVTGESGGSFGIEMHRGYFKIWRKLEDSTVYSDSNSFRVFFDLLIRANWKEGRKIIFKGKEITLVPGQLTVGRFELASRLNLNPSTTYKTLNKLKDLYKIIDIKSNSKFTLVTILNWDSYQNGAYEKEQQSNNGVTTKEQQSNTLKESKKVRKKELILSTQQEKDNQCLVVSKSQPNNIEDALVYFKEIGAVEEAEPFFDHFTANGWRVGGKTPMKDWKAAARNWLRSPYRKNDKKLFRGKQDLVDTANALKKEMETW